MDRDHVLIPIDEILDRNVQLQRVLNHTRHLHDCRIECNPVPSSQMSLDVPRPLIRNVKIIVEGYGIIEKDEDRFRVMFSREGG